MVSSALEIFCLLTSLDGLWWAKVGSWYEGCYSVFLFSFELLRLRLYSL